MLLGPGNGCGACYYKNGEHAVWCPVPKAQLEHQQALRKALDETLKEIKPNLTWQHRVAVALGLTHDNHKITKFTIEIDARYPDKLLVHADILIPQEGIPPFVKSIEDLEITVTTPTKSGLIQLIEQGLPPYE